MLVNLVRLKFSQTEAKDVEGRSWLLKGYLDLLLCISQSFNNCNSIVIYSLCEMLRVAARRVQSVTIATSRALSAVASSADQSTVNTNVPGLSEDVVRVPNTPVGPNASKDKEYKNPEYFCYHVDSFSQAEAELARYRLPAPSNKKPFNK